MAFAVTFAILVPFFSVFFRQLRKNTNILAHPVPFAPLKFCVETLQLENVSEETVIHNTCHCKQKLQG